MSREQDLLLGALNDGRGVQVVGFFEFLAGNVRKLGFGYQALGFGADQLLLQRDELGGFGLFVLELLDLVLDLRETSSSAISPSRPMINMTKTNLLLMRPTRLHATLRIANLLQHPPTVLQPLRIQILLLRNLRQQHAQLVADVAHGFILRALAPLAQLAGDRGGFLGRGFVGADGVVFGLDEAVEALGELGLLDAAERGEGEVVFAAAGGLGGAAGVAALGADGVGASDVPGWCKDGW